MIKRMQRMLERFRFGGTGLSPGDPKRKESASAPGPFSLGSRGPRVVRQVPQHPLHPMHPMHPLEPCT
jgi:hypothetical protein